MTGKRLPRLFKFNFVGLPYFKKAHPRALFRLFLVFSNKHYYYLQQFNVKNAHRVYSPWVQTHDLYTIVSSHNL